MVFYYLVSLGPSYHLTQLSEVSKGKSREVDYPIGVYFFWSKKYTQPTNSNTHIIGIKLESKNSFNKSYIY